MISKWTDGHQRWMYFSTLTVSSSNLGMSLAASWTSPTLAKMLHEKKYGITHREGAILDALLPGGAIAAGIMARFALDKIGRKQATVLGGVFFLISWAILAFSRGLFFIYVARFVAGLAVGTLYLSSGIYIAEVTPREVRHMLFAVSQLFTNLGFLVEYCIGPYVHYMTLIWVSAVPSFIFLLLVPFIAESPYYLVSKGYYEEARETLERLRCGKDPLKVATEFKSIQEAVGESRVTSIHDLLSSGNRRALFLASSAMVVKQMTGGWAIVSFAGPLLEEGGLQQDIASATLGATKLLTSAVVIFLVLKFGIKKLVVLSLFGIAVTHTILLVYFFLQESYNLTLEKFQWVPLVTLITYFIFSDFGIGPFPSFLGAELFTQKAKGLGTTIALTVGHIFGLMTIFLFTSSGDFTISIGVFTISTIISIPFTMIFLVDTKGKSLLEIQRRLSISPKEDLQNHI